MRARTMGLLSWGCLAAGCAQMGNPPPWWGQGAEPLRCTAVDDAPSLEPGQIEVAGGQEPAHVQRVLGARFADFQSCYQHGLRLDDDSEGSATFRLRVDTEGDVQSACVESQTTGDDATLQCLLYEMRRARFELAPKPSRIRFSFKMLALPGPGE